MNNPSFKELLYCYSLDTGLDSEAEEVTSLVNHIYQGFFGHTKANVLIEHYTL